jgi:subtilisin family serine protease
MVPNEFYVGVRSAGTKRETRLRLPGSLRVTESEVLFGGTDTPRVIRYQTASQIRVEHLAQIQIENPDLVWVSPGFVYEGDPLEDVPQKELPNDPEFPKQRHHFLAHMPEAWAAVGAGSNDVVVAVTDDGVDSQHEDLVDRMWTNPREIPGNGIDDDGNGFVDDDRGWNFADNTNNPDPKDPTHDHGTHVAGIVAATLGNGKGLAGAAGGVRVMPLKIYNYSSFSSAVVAKAFAYAADNGAKIITTSYNVDGFVNDPVYLAGVEYAYSKGVLQFNSAGNNAQETPPRAQLQQLLLVCSTDASGGRDDLVSLFSNYGLGVDVCAPGGGIYSTVPGNKYRQMSGTSMATPFAAGVAALIWSQHPEWSREQVASQLLGTAQNLDGLNPAFIGKMGSGRVDGAGSVSGLPAPPRLLPARRSPEGLVLIDVAGGNLDPSGFQGGSPFVFESGGAPELARPYQISTNTIELKLPGGMAAGHYTLRTRTGAVKSPFGAAVGDDYRVELDVR